MYKYIYDFTGILLQILDVSSYIFCIFIINLIIYCAIITLVFVHFSNASFIVHFYGY